ncbi:MAG: hypothetical protein RIS45_353 [Planctomycetota bacterium]
MSLSKRRMASNIGRVPATRAAASARAVIGRRSPLDAALGAFCTECDAAIVALRHALRTLADAAGSDPLRPQDVSRKFAINKNLTWKFARVLLAADSFEAIAMLPGSEGVEIYLRAFETAGIGRAHTDSVRDALRQFDAVVARHFGDRAQLEVVLDGLRSDGNLESSRRMAFKGMSGVFGMRARVRLTMQLLFPSAETPGMGDIAQVVGTAGLQRLRPIGALPVFRTSAQSEAAASRLQPLFNSPQGEHTEFLLREFSSFPNATVCARDLPGRKVIELSEGPLGRIGESDLFFGTLIRGTMNIRRVPGDASNDFVSNVSIPSESLVLDFYCHRSLIGTESMATSVHSTLGQPLTGDDAQREQTALPIDLAPLAFEHLTEAPAIPTMPRYQQMVDFAFRATGQDIREFRLMRVAIEFPPAPAAVLVKWTLPE